MATGVCPAACLSDTGHRPLPCHRPCCTAVAFLLSHTPCWTAGQHGRPVHDRAALLRLLSCVAASRRSGTRALDSGRDKCARRAATGQRPHPLARPQAFLHGHRSFLHGHRPLGICGAVGGARTVTIQVKSCPWMERDIEAVSTAADKGSQRLEMCTNLFSVSMRVYQIKKHSPPHPHPWAKM